MSDRRADRDIEGVVASIRRLVADELPPLTTVAAPRLILTPALRVDVTLESEEERSVATRLLATRMAGLENLLDAEEQALDAPFAAGPTDSAAPPAGAAAVLTADEVALRALVRDVLEAELQGDLGERITRNLRKMVRAELGRALALRGIG